MSKGSQGAATVLHVLPPSTERQRFGPEVYQATGLAAVPLRAVPCWG